MLGNPISHAVWTVKQCHPLRALFTQLALAFFISSFLFFLLLNLSGKQAPYLGALGRSPGFPFQPTIPCSHRFHPSCDLPRGLSAGLHPLGYSPFVPPPASYPFQTHQLCIRVGSAPSIPALLTERVRHMQQGLARCQELLSVLGMFSRTSWLMWEMSPALGRKDSINLAKGICPSKKVHIIRTSPIRVGWGCSQDWDTSKPLAAYSSEMQLFQFHVCTRERISVQLAQCEAQAVLQPVVVLCCFSFFYFLCCFYSMMPRVCFACPWLQHELAR